MLVQKEYEDHHAPAIDRNPRSRSPRPSTGLTTTAHRTKARNRGPLEPYRQSIASGNGNETIAHIEATLAASRDAYNAANHANTLVLQAAAAFH